MEIKGWVFRTVFNEKENYCGEFGYYYNGPDSQNGTTLKPVITPYNL